MLPLLIVTSNREKELPAAFLRRCLFYYIPFPTPEDIKDIMESHFQNPHTRLFDEAVKKFWQLREQNQFTWQKMPSTSELLDWLRCLSRSKEPGALTAEQLAKTPLSALPHIGVLVKKHEDQLAIERVENAVKQVNTSNQPFLEPSLLFDVFEDLRRQGVTLGLEEYLVLNRVVETGKGLESYADFKRLCQLVWATSYDDLALIDQAFARIVDPWLLAPLPKRAGGK